MHNLRRVHSARKPLILLATILGSGTLFSDGCFDSAIGQRFRDATAGGLTQGLSSAITDPTNAETGLRDAAAALINGLGAIIETRGASGSSNSNGSSGQTSSGT